jgi:hypothetical protein
MRSSQRRHRHGRRNHLSAAPNCVEYALQNDMAARTRKTTCMMTQKTRHFAALLTSRILRMVALGVGLAYLAVQASDVPTAVASVGHQTPLAAAGALYQEIANQQVGYSFNDHNVSMGGRVVLCRNGAAIYYEFETRTTSYASTSKHANSIGTITALEDGGSRLVALVRFTQSTRPAGKAPFSGRFELRGNGGAPTIHVETTPGLILDKTFIAARIDGKVDANADCAAALRKLSPT